MSPIQRLWRDESASGVSAAVMVAGVLGTVAAGAGIGMGSAANDEGMKDVGPVLKRLDQSYSVPGRRRGQAWTAPSTFRDASVEDSSRGRQPGTATATPPTSENGVTAPAQRPADELRESVPEVAPPSSEHFTRKWFKSPKGETNDGRPVVGSDVFFHSDPLRVTEDTNIASVTIALSGKSEVHLQANTSVIARGDLQTFATGFSVDDSADGEAWAKSMRVVTVPAPDQHVMVTLIHSLILTPGKYTIQWRIRLPEEGGELALDAGGAMTVQAFPTDPGNG